MSDHRHTQSPDHYHRHPRDNSHHLADHYHERQRTYHDDHRFESHRNPPYPPHDYHPKSQLPHNGRKRGRRSSQTHVYGYGGASDRSSPDRFSRGAPFEDHIPYRRHHATSSSPLRDPDYPQFYRTESHRNDSRSPTNGSIKPENSTNPYKGGCPYQTVAVRVREPDRTRSYDANPSSKSAGLRDDEISSKPLQYHGGARQISGPLKRLSSSISPVKPVPVPSTSKSIISPLAQISHNAAQASDRHDANADNRKVDIPVPAHVVDNDAGRLQSHLQPDKKFCRTLSCEKKSKSEERSLPGHRRTRSTPVPYRYSPIAHPVESSSSRRPMASSHEEVQENGSLSKGQIRRSEMRDAAHEPERGGQRSTIMPKNEIPVSKLFSKATRVPQIPDEDLSASFTPLIPQKDDRKLQQHKETRKFDYVPRKVDPPRLRSAPAPASYATSVDTSRRATISVAREGAESQGQTSVKLRADHINLNRHQSPTSAPVIAPHYLEESEETAVLDPNVQIVKHKLTSSIAKMNIAERNEACPFSATEEEDLGKKDGGNQACDDEKVQGSILRGEIKAPSACKRKARAQRETRAKRARPNMPSETVTLDDSAGLRRSGRFQQFKATNDWETVKFDQERVQDLFMTQLKRQPMLLRISFLGISDGDLRATLDMWDRTKRLPDPDLRRLEANNNRIRRITDYMCAQICALKVISLNLSCNLITTIGVKIGLSSKLKFLNISRNQLSCLPQELCDLTNLEVLNMSHNNISRLPAGLSRLIRLEALCLAWNKLKVLPEDVAAEGAALSDLDISHNEGFHFFPRSAEHWTRLESLHLPHTTIYKSLSRREQRMDASTLVQELAGRRQDMFNG